MPEKKNTPKKVSLRVDPSSGKFIVSDIFSPRAKARASQLTPSKIKSPPPHPKKSSAGPDADPITRWFRHVPTVEPTHPQGRQHSPRTRHIRRRALFFTIAALVAAAMGYAISVTQARLRVVIQPKREARQIDAEVSVRVSATNSTIAGERIAFSTTQTHDVPASQLRDVRRKAAGTVLLYNNFSSASQKLVAGTRLEAPDGKIFRILSSVTIPGASVTGSKVISPGTIETVAQADKAGAEYNLDSANFSIPGFLGNPKHDGFYAKAKGKFSGGFAGRVVSASGSDIANASATLDTAARAQLVSDLSAKIPPGFKLIDNGYDISTTLQPLDQPVGLATTLRADMLVEARAIIFRPEDMARALATRAGFTPGQAVLANPEALTYRLTRKSIPNGELTIRVTGTGSFVWQVDTGAIATAISKAGSVPLLNDIFKSYPAIGKADVTFSPRWVRSIPHTPERILVEVKK